MNITRLEADYIYWERLSFCSDLASRPFHSKNSDSPQPLSDKAIKFRKIYTRISWGITLCSTLKVIRRFGGTCSLHIHGRRISQAKNQKLLKAGFFLGLLFNPHDESDMFLWNIGWFPPDYTTALSRRRKNSLW
jgi:hypothetical protein